MYKLVTNFQITSAQIIIAVEKNIFEPIGNISAYLILVSRRLILPILSSMREGV